MKNIFERFKQKPEPIENDEKAIIDTPADEFILYHANQLFDACKSAGRETTYGDSGMQSLNLWSHVNADGARSMEVDCTRGTGENWRIVGKRTKEKDA